MAQRMSIPGKHALGRLGWHLHFCLEPLDRGHPPACRAGAEGEEMNRLRRFHETVPHGQTSSRVAYATSASALFRSLPDVVWAEDTEFNLGDAILADPTLKGVYREAILNGWAEAKGKS